MTQPTEAQRANPTRVAGLAVWTNNAAEARPTTAKIPKLWTRFTSEGWFGRLERIGGVGPPVAVYTDYRTDVSGDYQIVVGREVPAAAGSLSGLQSTSIPAGRYLIFRFKGTVPDVVIDGWRRVWMFFEQTRTFQRAYSADLEMYDAEGAGVEIWIAVR